MNLCVNSNLPIFCVQNEGCVHCWMYSSKMGPFTSSSVQSIVQFSWWTELHTKQSKHWVLTTNIQQMNRKKNCFWVTSIIMTDFLLYYCLGHNLSERFFNKKCIPSHLRCVFLQPKNGGFYSGALWCSMMKLSQKQIIDLWN